MASFLASTCWPTRFFAKWLAVFFGASLIGLVLSWFVHRHPAAKPVPPVVARVQVNLRAVEIYADGTRALVPALVSTGGTGDKPIPESDQGPLSVNPKKPTAISRMPGSKLWLIFQWQGRSESRLINPWPHSTITYQVEFRLNRSHPSRLQHLKTAQSLATPQRRAERTHA